MPNAKSVKSKKKKKRKKRSYSRKKLMRWLQDEKAPKKTITTGEAARVLGVSLVTVRRWVDEGLLKGKKAKAEASGRQNQTKIKLIALKKFIESSEMPIEYLKKKRVTTTQIAKTSGISVSKVIQLADKGDIKAYRLCGRRIILLKDAISYFKANELDVEALRVEAKK